MRRPGRSVLLGVALVAALIAALLIVRGRPSSPAETSSTAGSPSRDVAAPKPTPRTSAPVELAGPIALSAATASPAPDAPAGLLAGRVLDWGSGAPVPGAEVAIEGDQGGVSSFTSGADGQFEVRPPAAGRYRLVSALAAGYLPWAPEAGASPLELVARPGVRVDGVVLYLVPAIEYHGRVLDPDGAPVAGATVVLLDAAVGERAGAPIEDTFTSGADGGFLFHAPDDALLEARMAGFAPGRARVDGAVAVSRELTIRLGARGGAAPPGLAIDGIVVDEDGEPVADARLIAVPDGAGRRGDVGRTGEARSGADGRFSITGLDDRPYTVRALAPHHAGDPVSAPAGTRDLRIVLERAAQLTGRVVAPDGKPVPAATVAVLLDAGLTMAPVAVTSYFDAEGRFVVDDLVEGDYRVVAQAHGWAPSAALPASTGTDVTITLRRGATVIGTMSDASTHAPLAGGKVTVEGSLGEGSSAIPLVTTAITAADGSFELAGIAPGRRSLTAGAYGHDIAIVGPLDIPDGARLGPIAVELSPIAPGETPKIELAGIGAALTAAETDLVVERVIPGGGAEAAGLLAGDHVLAVDGTPISALGLDGAIQLIRGPVGTQVTLTILRTPAAPTDLTVTRTKIRT